MLHNVAAQNIAELLGECLQAVYGAMCAFLLAIGVRIRNKPGFKNWFDDIANGVMHDAVTKWRGADFSLLGFVNYEMHILTWLISEAGQFLLQL